MLETARPGVSITATRIPASTLKPTIPAMDPRMLPDRGFWADMLEILRDGLIKQAE
jgi:hypothetical protein